MVSEPTSAQFFSILENSEKFYISENLKKLKFQQKHEIFDEKLQNVVYSNGAQNCENLVDFEKINVEK